MVDSKTRKQQRHVMRSSLKRNSGGTMFAQKKKIITLFFNFNYNSVIDICNNKKL